MKSRDQFAYKRKILKARARAPFFLAWAFGKLKHLCIYNFHIDSVHWNRMRCDAMRCMVSSLLYSLERGFIRYN